MKTCFIAALLGCSVLSVACGGSPDASEVAEHTKATGSAIILGTASGTDDDAVVAIGIHTNEGSYSGWCSGTLIAPNLVLTARHCVSNVDDTDMICNAQGESVQHGDVLSDHPARELRIYVGQGAGAVAATETTALTPKAAARGARLITDGATSICNHDVALIVLDQDIAGTYAPLHFDAPTVNEHVTIVGFGITEMGTMPADRLKTDVTVEYLGPFSNPSDAEIAIGDAEMFVSVGACRGDSGGPMFDASHGVLALASRVGFGDGTGAAAICYGGFATATYAALGPKRALIESAFAAAGKPMWLEGDPNPFTAVTPAATPPVEDATPVAAGPAPAATTSTGGCNTSGGAPIDASAFVVLGLVLAARLTGTRKRALL